MNDLIQGKYRNLNTRKTAQLLLSAISSFFLISCGPNYQESISTSLPPQSGTNGFLAIAFTRDIQCPKTPEFELGQVTKYFAPKSEKNTAFAIVLGAPEQTKYAFELGRIYIPYEDFEESDYKDVVGKLALVEMPPGVYSLDGPAAIQGRHSGLTYSSNFYDVAITIEPKKITYAGSFNIQLKCTPYSWGQKISAGSANIKDMKERDIPLLKKKFPLFAAIPIKYNTSEKSTSKIFVQNSNDKIFVRTPHY